MNDSQQSTSRRIVRLPTAPPPPEKKRFPWWTVIVIVACVGLLIATYAFASEQFTNYADFQAKCAVAAQDIFHGNIYIDDIAIGGMTMEEARALLLDRAQQQSQSFEITLAAGDSQWRISSSDVPMSWNTESLLQQARLTGRRGSLEQRYQEIINATEPVRLYSEFTYDKSAIQTLTRTIAAHLTEEPVNASVLAFNVSDRSFSFSEERPGKSVDAGQLYQTVVDALDAGQYGTTIPINIVDIPPSLTRADLERSYTRIASFTTNTTSDSNRNNNINLAAHALNGQVIRPGETISFNETTGERTGDKGYLPAGAIENGRTVQEYGGGVCQVSTTLFNALLRANCEIVSRKPHAWPSEYVPRGEDAAVDWPGLDLVMRNASDISMFITAWYENQRITVEVYGLSLGEGVSIELESATTYSKESTEIVYTYNPDLPVGTTKLLRNPRTGYSVQTYKLWMQDGVETSREELYKSEYRVINEEYEYNDGIPPADT